jgi:phosphate uptake regulator
MTVSRAVRISYVAKYLERIADHATLEKVIVSIKKFFINRSGHYLTTQCFLVLNLIDGSNE